MAAINVILGIEIHEFSYYPGLRPVLGTLPQNLTAPGSRYFCSGLQTTFVVEDSWKLWSKNVIGNKRRTSRGGQFQGESLQP